MTNTYLARLPHRPEDAARMVREFSDAYWRLPSLALLRDFEARAPYRFLLPADTAGVVSLQRELPAEWQEIKTKIEALHESAVQSLKRQVFWSLRRPMSPDDPGRVLALVHMNGSEREALGAFRRSLELAVEHATSDHVRLTLPTERARLLLGLLTPDDADVEEADRDELWVTLLRLARHLCDCDQMECRDTIDPRQHRAACRYALAYSVEPESTEPLVWDDNFTLAEG